jgi:hypothetical protein
MGTAMPVSCRERKNFAANQQLTQFAATATLPENVKILGGSNAQAIT